MTFTKHVPYRRAPGTLSRYVVATVSKLTALCCLLHPETTKAQCGNWQGWVPFVFLQSAAQPEQRARELSWKRTSGLHAFEQNIRTREISKHGSAHPPPRGGARRRLGLQYGDAAAPSAAVQSRRPAANAMRMINLFGNLVSLLHKIRPAEATPWALLMPMPMRPCLTLPPQRP